MTVKEFHDYVVYSDGRIYSRKTNKFLKHDHCNSYAQITLRIEGEPKRFYVHRLIAYLFCEWVTCTENNRRAREKGFNDVSLSNSNRWKCEDFRIKTAKNISAGQIASGCFSGKRNPRYRFEIHGEGEKIYMMSELPALTGKSLTWVYNHIVNFLNGADVPEFKNCGIVSIVDLKGKVNRLSKAERQVE